MPALRHSDSSLAVYKSCPLKYKYSRLDGLESIHGAPIHDLRFGSAWDEAMNALYAPDGSVQAARDAFAAEYPADEYPAELPRWATGKTFANGMAAIAAYARRWYEDDQHWEILEIQRLENTESEAEVSRVVKLDLIVRDKRDSQVYGIDTKTTGKYLRDLWKQFEPHSQIRSYVLHITKRFGHCGGFIINAASFRHRMKAYTPRKGPQKGIALPAGDWFDFQRMTFNPNSECLALERQNIAYWTHRIESDAELGIFGYNTQECHRGGVECEYWRLCSAGWTWPGDAPLIEPYYRQVCLEVLRDGDSRCRLDRGHQGRHSPDAPKVAPIADYEVFDDNEADVEKAAI